MFKIEKESLISIPKKPGIYIYKNSANSIIYIGKAKNLKNRINQYFSQSHENSIKTQFLVKNIFSFEYIIVDNEIEALLLENKLIKKHKPKYNINLKDSKTYPYIKITDDVLPKIQFTRIVTNKGTYFGPFTNGEIRKEIFFLVVKLFQLITLATYSSSSTINYQIGLAPAKNLKSINKEKYLIQVEQAKDFLKGNTTKIKQKLTQEMLKASKEMKFEIANEKKKQLEAIKTLKEKQKVDLLKNYDEDIIVKLENQTENKSLIQILKIKKGVISSKKEYKFNYCDNELIEEFLKIYYSQNSVPKEILLEKEIFETQKEKEIIEQYLSKIRKGKINIKVPKRGEKLGLIKLSILNAKQNFNKNDILLELKNRLNLPSIPKTIECFDMSNLGSDYLVGAMVQFKNAEPNKQAYRKYQIKSFSGKNDDFAAMQEVIYRRYIRLRNENKPYPNLILIDGGKGQLRSGIQALKNLNIKIPIISLAKRDEEIYVLGRKDPYKFNQTSKMMLFLRNIRDTTHNYVINYNRKKREMRMKEEFKKIK